MAASLQMRVLTFYRDRKGYEIHVADAATELNITQAQASQAAYQMAKLNPALHKVSKGVYIYRALPANPDQPDLKKGDMLEIISVVDGGFIAEDEHGLAVYSVKKIKL